MAKAMNTEVANLVWEAGKGRSLRSYSLSRLYFSIRHDIELRIPADFYLVEDGIPVVFWLQPRKNFTLDNFGRRLLASVIHQRLSSEWDQFDFEILDTSPLAAGEERNARTFRFAKLPLLPEFEVAAVMQQLADAVDVVRGMDLDLGRGRGEDPDPPNVPGPLFRGP